MSYVGFSGVADLALTHPAWAAGVTAATATDGFIGAGVGGDTVIWMGAGGIEPGYILMETSGESDPLDYVLEENSFRIRLEIY